MSLSELDPSVAQAEQFIEKQKLPPDKAVDYLLSKGVDPRLASLVMKYRVLKQSSANQPKSGQPGQAQQPLPKTVSQDIDEQINAQSSQRGQGVSGLPVPSSTFSMAGGGIVAFDGGGMATPTDPTDLANIQQQQLYQGIMDQQAQQNSSTIAQGARGGVVAFDDGGETDEDDLTAQQSAIYQRQLKNWQRQNAQNYLAKGQQLGVAPQQAQQSNKAGGRIKIKHLDAGGPPGTPGPPGPPVPGAQMSQAAQAMLNPPDPNAGIPPDIQREINAHQTLGTPLSPQAAQFMQQQQQASQAAQSKQPGPMGPGPTGPPGPRMGVAPPGATPPAPPQSPAPQGAPSPTPPPPTPSQGMSMRASGPAGGVPTGSTGMPVSEQQKITSDQAMLADNKPLATSQYYDQLSEIAEKQGLGTAAKAHIEQLSKMQTQLEGYKQQGNWMALTKAGFAMATAATQNPHGGFLGALAVGGESGAHAYQENISQYRDMSMKLNEQKYVVQQTQENLLNDRTKEAVSERNNAVSHYDSLAARVSSAQDAALARVTSTQIAAQARIATILSKPAPFSIQVAAYQDMVHNQNIPPEEALKRVNAVSSPVQAAQIRGAVQSQAGLERLYISPAYQMAFNKSLSTNPKLAAQGQAEVERLESVAQNPGAAPAPDTAAGQWTVTPR